MARVNHKARALQPGLQTSVYLLKQDARGSFIVAKALI
jgi:hypothetical protein